MLGGMRKLVVIIAVALSLAACGKGNAPPISDAELAQARLHNACMRSAGVDVPDPEELGEGGNFTLNTKDPKTLAALSACAKLDPGGHREGDPDPALEERTLKLAECLRKQGIRAKDPDPDQPLTVALEDGATYSQQQLVDAYTVCGKDVAK